MSFWKTRQLQPVCRQRVQVNQTGEASNNKTCHRWQWRLPKELEESNIHAAGYIGWINARCGATVGGAV